MGSTISKTDESTVTQSEAAEATPAEGRRFGLPLWIATAGGAGLAPVAPGTAGSLVGVALFFLLSQLGLPLYLLTVLALAAVGVWASDLAESYFERPDDGRIVIDEVAGQLIGLMPLVALRGIPLGEWRLPDTWGATNLAVGAFFALVVTGFVAFRVFDIWKPGPVRWAEQRFQGGVGVMADDIVAGVFGAVVLTLVAYAVVVGEMETLLETLNSGSDVTAVAAIGISISVGLGVGSRE